MSRSDEVPVPTCPDAATRECPATMSTADLGTVQDLVDRQRSIRDRLDERRRERFLAGESVYEVDVGTVASSGERSALPAASLAAVAAASDERWRVAYRAMVLAGYPPGEAHGQCDRPAALEVVRDGESTAYRTLWTPTHDVERIEGPDDSAELRVTGDGGRTLTVGVDERVADGFEAADRLGLTLYSQRAREVVSSLGEAFDDAPAVTATLDRSTTERRYVDADDGPEDPAASAHFDRLQSAPPLPDDRARSALLAVFEDGRFTCREQIAVARVATGDADAVTLRYGDRNPKLRLEVGRLLDADCVGLPQRGRILVTRQPVPAALSEAETDFPDRQSLTDTEAAALERALDRPDWAVASPDRRTIGLVAERLAAAAERGECPPTAALAHEVSPWSPAPAPSALAADRRTGERILGAIDGGSPTSSRRSAPTESDASLAEHALGAMKDRALGATRGPTDR